MNAETMVKALGGRWHGTAWNNLLAISNRLTSITKHKWATVS